MGTALHYKLPCSDKECGGFFAGRWSISEEPKELREVDIWINRERKQVKICKIKQEYKISTQKLLQVKFR
ncbi:hypothetical protein CPT76_05040 [Paenibacillus sp. AR247]|nr:hypothetical protein CPT76_05040 [Paenibacillus sp. AR247]